MLLAFTIATLLAQGALQEKILADFCDGTRAKGDLEALRALGEPGRLALLELAPSDTIEAGCAFEDLANLDDRRVLPFLRESLSGESARFRPSAGRPSPFSGSSRTWSPSTASSRSIIRATTACS